MDLCKNTVKQVFDKMNMLDDRVKFEEFKEWMKKEYRTFMLVPKDNYAETLQNWLELKPEFKDYVNICLEHLYDYGGPQALYRVGMGEK